MKSVGEERFVEIRLDTLRAGVPLGDVSRVLRAAHVTPVPGSHDCLFGYLDLHGEAVPVYNTRRLLGLPARAISPHDRFLVTRHPGGECVFVVDDVGGVFECAGLAPTGSFAADAAGVRGIGRDASGMLLVHDLRRFMHIERALHVHGR